MTEYRYDPNDLLAAIQRNQTRRGRGNFKIFFGAVAGVGKTYAMLEGAQQLKYKGVDVIVGWVETHGRAETEALLNTFDVLPRLKLEYHGTTREELDLDAVLARRPKLVLIDDLAHANAPGMRHVKRYQDVLEILEAGIDVWTTVNVQHVESRADTVRQITGVAVSETIPDSLLELADEMELIDLAPEELRKRLFEGKVYTPEQAELAARSFFRTGNLTALREMALRLTAERVDHQLQDYMQIKHIAGPWKSADRLLVAVSPSPLSERLIRWTRRMAYNLEAEWLAVYVDSPHLLTDDDKARLAHNLALARQLGGEVISTTGQDVIEALMRIARQRNVTQIVIGKPAHSRLQDLLRGGSIVNRLVRASGDIDVYVVTGDPSESVPQPRLPHPESHSKGHQYAIGTVIILLVTLLNLLMLPVIGYQAVGLTGLLAVLLIAAYIGRGPALLAAALSAISWDMLFIPPRFTITITRLEDIIVLGLYFFIAIFTGNLTARIRAQQRQARGYAEHTLALYTLARETATAVDMDSILATVIAQIGRVFDAEAAIFLRTPANRLAEQPHPSSTLAINAREFSVAAWVLEYRKPAGRFTETLAAAEAKYLPLLTPGETVGVLAVRARKNEPLTVDEEALLDTFARQVALIIERELLDEAAEQSAMLRESERLYSTLLNSISHELRTPIATIVGAASSLTDPNVNAAAHGALISDIQTAAERLNQLVANLLDMTRLESGRLKLKLEWCDIGDLIDVAVSTTAPRLTGHPLTLSLAPDLPLLQTDFVLMEQVLVNLLDNVARYTPPGTPVLIGTALEDSVISIAVADEGPGLPPEDLERVFDKFYRVPGSAAGGTGLGLSICRGLVSAHGGTLEASNRPGGGAQFTIRLPVTDPPPPAREAAL